ncbi:hypothetical protein ACJRO7_035926 [Eucalyptus globulus]|uniref:RNase H type-1 domain-containing protein n=1 Tax=Eucalyptus globulus TaxID=34317 RepID=A0ABD3JCL4_EUCGL
MQLAIAEAQSRRIFATPEPRPISKQRILNHKWHPPDHGVIKINIDAAYHSSCTDASVAGMCRDSSGHLIDGFALSVRASSALQAEAIAFNLTLHFLL